MPRPYTIYHEDFKSCFFVGRVLRSLESTRKIRSCNASNGNKDTIFYRDQHINLFFPVTESIFPHHRHGNSFSKIAWRMRLKFGRISELNNNLVLSKKDLISLRQNWGFQEIYLLTSLIGAYDKTKVRYILEFCF